MVTNTWIQTNPIDNLPGIQPVRGRVAVQLIEVGYPHGQVGIGKQLDGLCLRGIREQHRDIFTNRTFRE